jgi:hypothetical protein
MQHREGTFVVLGALAACLWAGCVSDSSGIGPYSGPDLAPPSDMGFNAADAPGFTETLVLRTPAPLSSGVATDVSLVFDVTTTGSQNLEQVISISPRGKQVPVGGAFTWRSRGGLSYELRFTPSGPLDDLTDYVVVARDPRNAALELLRTGFTTGSRPRVVKVELHVEQSGAAAHFLVGFSEPMKHSSLSSSLLAIADDVPTPGTLVATATDMVREVRYDFAAGLVGLTLPVGVRIKPGAVAASGSPLDSHSWDSSTETTPGTFEVIFSAAERDKTAVYTWTPEIN